MKMSVNIKRYSAYLPKTCPRKQKLVPRGVNSSTEPIKGHCVTDLSDIRAGKYGSECKGSIPLESFEELLKTDKKLLARGQSTNYKGFAFSFLKSKASNPVSTSLVFDCSVMYLYNKKTDTHMLYHMYKGADSREISSVIRILMPEGFTHASLVPGEKGFQKVHASYLPEVFETIKKNNPDAKIYVYHNSSKLPEIVGYKGKMYEIPRKKQRIKNIVNTLFHRKSDKPTFKIDDLRTLTTLSEISTSNDVKNLKKIKKYQHSQNHSPEVLAIIDRLIKERIEELKKIRHIDSIDNLKGYIKSCGREYVVGNCDIGFHGYYTALIERSKKLTGEAVDMFA